MATELKSRVNDAPAPRPPTDEEKYLYLHRNQWVLIPLSCISFAGVMLSTYHFMLTNPLMLWLYPYVAFTVLYFLISLVVDVHFGGFNLKKHKLLVEWWAESALYTSVDFLLPTSGEDLTVLTNTWNGVRALIANHYGECDVFVLDDSDREEVRDLAERYGFSYSVRDNPGWMKKAGNLNYGFHISRPLRHQFLVIFDADFRPRVDFLQELIPYMLEDDKLGLVQSPQWFDVRPEQSWLQKGAGEVQEFFYRFSQVARQSHDAAICVGTNAIYRRAALDQTGGTALIEHSEDVHTGFNMRMYGWGLRYVPLILAKGVCPDSMESFWKQQYRWCMGSMSLLASAKFWKTRMKFRARLSYFTGFCYYIHTAFSLFYVSIIPLTLIILDPAAVTLRNYISLLPSAIYVFIIFPSWHRVDYSAEAWSVKHLYSWAHLFAIIDVMRRKPMGWTATGAKSSGSNGRYRTFRILQVLISLVPSLAWASCAAFRVALLHEYVFLPLLLSGLFATYTIARVTLHRDRRHISQSYHEAIGGPTTIMPLSSLGQKSAELGALYTQEEETE